MPQADFGAWLPDQPEIGAPPHLRVAQNVIPTLLGYGPLASLTETTDALASRCRGLYGARDANQAGRLYAGDSTGLYQLSGMAWEDQSQAGGYGPAVDNTRWRFATYGDRLLAANGIDALQYQDMSAGGDFADLPNLSESPEYVCVYGEFVFVAGGSLGANVLKWSARGDSEGWTPGVSESDEQELPDGGRITGLVTIRSALYVIQEQCIRRVQDVGGDVIVTIEKLTDAIGAVEPNSVVAYGQRCFFLAEDGWYQFDGASEPTPIGNEKFDRWFLDDSSRAYWYSMCGAIDPRKKCVVWAYASTSSGAGVPDSLLIYNYAVGKATYARMSCALVASAMSLAVSPDDLTDYVPDDHPEIGPDDPFWLGGALYLSAMTTDHTLASFSGDNMEATLQTSEQMLFDGRRASPQWAKLVSDAEGATVAVGAKVKPSDAIAFGAQVSQQASGRCPQRGANGFYHAARGVIPAGETWTYARGVEFDPGGARGVR